MPKARRKYPDSRVHPARPQTCLLAGKIMWLPKQDELQCDLGIEDGCYNHPVVVLSPFPESEKVVVLLITSLNGRALQDCRWTQDVRAGHLPVHPCDPHPDNGKLLHLRSNLELRKKSYVKTTRKINVPLDCLRDYHGRHALYCMFTAASYKELVESAQFQPPMASPSQTKPRHSASPEVSWSNNSGPEPTGFPTLPQTSRPAFTFTHPGIDHQVQHANRVNPVPITFTYAATVAARPPQYPRAEYHAPHRPALSEPSTFQANPYSNGELEHQIRSIAAARAGSYGTLMPSNTNPYRHDELERQIRSVAAVRAGSYGTMIPPHTSRNTRPAPRRSTNELPLPAQYERHVANTGDECCDLLKVIFILCFIFMIGFWNMSPVDQG